MSCPILTVIATTESAIPVSSTLHSKIAICRIHLQLCISFLIWRYSICNDVCALLLKFILNSWVFVMSMRSVALSFRHPFSMLTNSKHLSFSLRPWNNGFIEIFSAVKRTSNGVNLCQGTGLQEVLNDRFARLVINTGLRCDMS